MNRHISLTCARGLGLLLVWLSVLHSVAQDRTVQNRPYTDLRPLHFGVLLGTHLQDLELLNVGPQLVTLDDGTVVEKTISCDQDRWDPGFQVGVLGELRLNTNLQLRAAPAMYFGTRHLTFRNHSDLTAEGNPTEQRQEIKTAYISTAIDLIFSGNRVGNNRPYLIAGVTPMINLSGNEEDYLKLKRYDTFLEVGIGCDFYLPFFKLRPELKFMYSLTDNLDKDHAGKIKDRNKLMYTNSVSEGRGKIIALTLYFE